MCSLSTVTIKIKVYVPNFRLRYNYATLLVLLSCLSTFFVTYCRSHTAVFSPLS